MTKLATIFTIAVLAFTQPALAADEFVAQDGAATSDIDLDTPLGHFSFWVVPNVGIANALRTTLQISLINGDAEWRGQAVVALVSGDENAQLRFLSPSTSQTDPFGISLLHYKNKELVAEEDFPIRLKVGEKIDIAMNWSPDGTITVKAGNEDQRTVLLSSPVMRIEVTDSSCNSRFVPFTLGRVNTSPQSTQSSPQP